LRFKMPSLGGREKAILRSLYEDFSIVQQAVTDFGAVVSAVASKDVQGTSSSFQRVLEDEKRADDFHRRLGEQIAEGAFFGGIREDMLNLLEKIDNIADSAKGAARLIAAEETLDDFAITLLGSDQMKGFVGAIVATVDALGSALDAFNVSRKEIFERVTRVEEFEEAADAHKDEVAKRLFRIEHRPDAVTVVQMRDFLLVADNIADNAEDASDVVLILVTKGYG
jgi:predicted phosphate transport protein (TIGR00153 family)